MINKKFLAGFSLALVIMFFVSCAGETANEAKVYPLADFSPVERKATSVEEGKIVELNIFTTNDEHGWIFDWDFASDSQRMSRGNPRPSGLARVSTLYKKLSAENSNSMLLSAGDSIQGTILSYYYNFIENDIVNPIPALYEKMGYEAWTIGNHEVEQGNDVLLKIANEMSERGIEVLGANDVWEDDNSKPFFSLSLFDVFTINPPRKASDKAGSLRAGKSYGGSFLTGIFAVLVATPCTAPFMGAALGFAFSQTPLIIIVIFTSLSVGFALPFVLLGLFPALIKKIPKPGLWMNTFKEFMGFLLLGTVVYLLTTLNSLIGSSIKGVLWFLLLTGLAVWIYGKFGSVIEKKVKRIIVIVLSLLIVALSAVFFVDLDKVDKKSASDGIWQEFSTQLVQEYRADNKPVFIDFYADWCTSCKVNDAAVLNTSNIMKLFSDKDVQLLKGDFTAGDREIAKWLSDFDRAGVPLYILFRPGEEAVVFPEFLTQSMVKKELDKIRP